MHAVGHIFHMRLSRPVAFPYSGKHLLGNLSVQPAHAVCLLACVKREHAHGETLRSVGVLTAHVDEVIP
jgi:hypothetical protein